MMLKGAFVYDPAVLGYTLYYTTNFIFTGLGGFDRLPRHAVQHWRRGTGGDLAWSGGGTGVRLTLDPLLPGFLVLQCWPLSPRLPWRARVGR